MFFCLCLSVSLLACVCLSVRLSVCLSVCLPVCVSLPVCASICLSVSVYLSVCSAVLSGNCKLTSLLGSFLRALQRCLLTYTELEIIENVLLNDDCLDESG